MPYRRLPNTDKSRLRALKTLIETADKQALNGAPITYKTLHEARTMLGVFEKKVGEYNITYDTQISANKNSQQIVKNARMYISHFIQVLNLAVIRGEIKPEFKLLYKLEPDDFRVPDLSSEAALLEWGQNIIDGENLRISQGGGFPIYNPKIVTVRVHYDQFKNFKNSQKIYQDSTTRNQGGVEVLRPQVDEIILDAWNQIEKKFEALPLKQRVAECRKYGVIYYYRRGENEE